MTDSDKREEKGKQSKHKMTVTELEKLLDRTELEGGPIEIMPNGEVRALGTGETRGDRKPITLREDLGGEYAGS